VYIIPLLSNDSTVICCGCDHRMRDNMLLVDKFHCTCFPVTSSVDGEAANLLATSRCNGIWETIRHNRYNGLLPTPTCYGETGVMDFGLY